jgi:gliding motility-associated-like protein
VISDSIAQPPPLLVNANGDQTCYGQANGSATAVASGGTAPYSYSWYILPVQSGATAMQLYAGSYTVLATDANGCQNTAAAMIAELPSPEVVATGAATICQGGRVPLSVTGAKSYIWSPATSLSCDNCNNPIAAPANTITYIVVGIDSNNCSDTEKLTVTVIPRVPVSVGPDIDVCIGDPVQLQAHGGVAYIWSPEAGLNNSSISNPVSGTDTSITYKVVITENECFKDTLYQRVRVHKRPTVYLGPDKKGIPGATIQLHADTTNTIGIAWKPADHLSCDDCYDPVATLYKTITYKATVSSGVCEASDEIRIVVGCDDELFFIPNTFTPNGDGNNDRFWPIAEGVNQIDRFVIYDRWGEPVFTANRFPPNDPAYGWDGTYKGAELKPDVYVYYLESRCGNGEKIFLKGDISLIR